MDPIAAPACRLAHCCLRVTDLERTIAFYTEHLGYREGPSFLDDHGRKTGAYLALDDGTFIEIFETDEVEVGNGHLCFEVPDIEVVHAWFTDRGIAITEPFIGRSKARICFIHDPDGHSIEFNDYSDPECWISTWRREHTP